MRKEDLVVPTIQTTPWKLPQHFKRVNMYSHDVGQSRILQGAASIATQRYHTAMFHLATGHGLTNVSFCSFVAMCRPTQT